LAATLKSALGYQVFFEFHPDALRSCGHDPLKFARHLFDLEPDLIVEIDQHGKRLKRINSMSDFQSIIRECLTTKEMWKDYTNIFISKKAALSSEMLGLLPKEAV